MIDQRDLRLEMTTECVNNIRLARELGHNEEMCHALFQLTEKIARMEWGPDTIVDDFSIPEKFLIINKTKKKII
jgi:hypothetical protein